MTLLTSNANFAPTNKDTLLALHGGAYTMNLPELEETVHTIGSDGVELMPIRPPITASPLLRPLYRELRVITPEDAERYGYLITALHDGFLGKASEQPDPQLGIPTEKLVKRPEEGFLAKSLASAVMSSGEASLHELAAIAHRLGKEATITSVVFPDQQARVEIDQQQAALFPGGALIQPTPDVLAAWNIHPAKAAQPDTLIEQLKLRHYKVAAGLFHFYRKGKVVDYRIGEENRNTEDAVATYIDHFLKDDMLSEIHVELNRNDFTQFDPEWCKVSLQEAIALTRGSKKLRYLPLGRRLEQLRSANWKGNVVVELSAAGAVGILKAMRKKITKKNILAVHQDINGHLRKELPFLN